MYNMSYAIVESGGKQYKVKENDELFVEKLSLDEGSTVELKVVAFFKEGSFVFGAPFLQDASVKATVLKNGKGRKITVFTYKPKKNCKRKKGHRQPFSKIRIDSISG